MFKALLGLGAAVVALSVPAMAADTDFSEVLSKIRLPPGFRIEIFAEMPNPRAIEVGNPKGVIYVGSRHGHIYSLVDSNRDGRADEVQERVNGLNVPNGVAMQDSILYVGMQDRIANWPAPAELDADLRLDRLITIYDDMTNEFLHGWRYIGFGPDRKLYVSLGSPCNICEPPANAGRIMRMNPDGSDVEVVAEGVRNSVGFDWNPVTGDLWFTDNGADGMGDNIPPDELNHVTKVGQNFGFPYYGGKNTRLTGFEDKEPPVEVTPPVIEFGAHTANLGLDFYEGDMFPAEYRNDAFVAQHGSWDRTVPDGYRIMRVTFDDRGNATGTEVFADGWLSDGAAVGRPVDIEELPDGSLLVSDDFANVIYRISYGE
jgi:glucose/arabinose dehydrogenase